MKDAFFGFVLLLLPFYVKSSETRPACFILIDKVQGVTTISTLGTQWQVAVTQNTTLQFTEWSNGKQSKAPCWNSILNSPYPHHLISSFAALNNVLYVYYQDVWEDGVKDDKIFQCIVSQPDTFIWKPINNLSLPTFLLSHGSSDLGLRKAQLNQYLFYYFTYGWGSANFDRKNEEEKKVSAFNYHHKIYDYYKEP